MLAFLFLSSHRRLPLPWSLGALISLSLADSSLSPEIQLWRSKLALKEQASQHGNSFLGIAGEQLSPSPIKILLCPRKALLTEICCHPHSVPSIAFSRKPLCPASLGWVDT